jgi:zinc-ribbon domain
MAVFKSARHIPGAVRDLAPVARDLEKHFIIKGFEVHKEPTVAGGWRVDISKGGMFKAVLGMKSALSVDIEPSATGTQVNAGIGIFGQQAIPTAISMLIFWPVLLTQLWGMIEQSNLDDEAIDTVERSIAAHSNAPSVERAAGQAQASAKFCTSCGHALTVSAKFCPECGAKLG